MSTRPKIVIYGSEQCSYCLAARMLLNKRDLDYDDILVSPDPASREKMERLSGQRSVPQIFVDDKSIGGFDELYALERSGELDRMLDRSIATTDN